MAREGIAVFQNIGNYSPNDTASRHGRLGSWDFIWLFMRSILFIEDL
jgi:hypothetical protein